jgi:EF-hand domain pair
MASLWNSLRPTGGQSATRSLQAFVTSKAPTETNSTSIPALDQLRTQLAARGARGIVGLQRTFRIMDDDGSKSFNLAEFKKGVKQCNITISDTQLNQLFRFFDKDRSGTIDFDEFIQAVRVCNEIASEVSDIK